MRKQSAKLSDLETLIKLFLCVNYRAQLTMENIQVALRVRPLLEKERFSGEQNVWRISGQSVMLDSEPNSYAEIRKTSFTFDDVFAPNETNEIVYERKVKRVATSCLEGYNGTIFMYGQTGSGKTYTMLGYKSDNGLYNNQDIPITPRNNPQTVEKSDELEKMEEDYQDVMYGCNVESTLLGNSGILIQSLKEIFLEIENVD